MSSSITTSAATATTQPSPTSLPAETGTPLSASPSVVSAESIAYSRALGGTPHEGESLYFVIGDSVDSESAARAKLEAALPRFGDMQSYFVVQKSDNFEGMRPGWWVIVEAYRSRPSQDNLDFGKRGFPGAYVKKAVVRTSDPIPVYEDLVAQ